MKMKKIILPILIFFSPYLSSAQSIAEKQFHLNGYDKIYLELGGQAFYYSFNYERIIETNSTWYPSLKVGVSYTDGLIIPIGININKKLNQSQLTIGLGGMMEPIFAGVTTTSVGGVSTNTTEYIGTEFRGFFKLGYQYSKRESKWFFGVSFLPIIYHHSGVLTEETNRFGFFPWGGIQIGRYLWL